MVKEQLFSILSHWALSPKVNQIPKTSHFTIFVQENCSIRNKEGDLWGEKKRFNLLEKPKNGRKKG
jgi:hypothetical protein